MNLQPLVTIIIVSFNTQDLTLRCLTHVYESLGFTKTELEVILVDNNSTDKTVLKVGQAFPQVKIIRNSTNKGFGLGNNEGLKIAKGQYVLLLNTDAFLAKDSLQTLANIISHDQNITSVAPQLRYEDGSLQPSAGFFPTPTRVLAWMWWLDKLPLVKQLFNRPYHVFDSKAYQQSGFFDWLMGACVLFRRSDLIAVSGFDSQIFMYCEEVELYQRLFAKFHKPNLLTTATSVIHIGSASTKKASASRLVQELSGIKYLYAKHNPSLFGLIRVILYSGVILRRLIFALIPSRRASHAEYQKYTF